MMQYLARRLPELALMNASPAIAEVRDFDNYSIKFTNRLRNCEDAIMIEDDAAALIMCDPGRDHWNTVMGVFPRDTIALENGDIWLYRYREIESGDGNENDNLMHVTIADYRGHFSFHPLGADYHRPTSTLFVVNHHVDGSRIEVFKLDLSSPSGPIARHQRSIIDTKLHSPNAIAALSDVEFYVTNDHYFLAQDHSMLHTIEQYAGLPGGTVTHVSLPHENEKGGKVHTKIAGRVAFANGIALLNSTHLAVSSTNTVRVHIFSIRPDHTLDSKHRTLVLPAMPDNLAVDSAGTLYIAGHPRPFVLTIDINRRQECAERIARSQTPVSEEEQDECFDVHAPSWTAKWTPEEGLRELYVGRREFGSSTSVIADPKKGLGIITGLYERGILVWRE